jgi:hypothetical protein
MTHRSRYYPWCRNLWVRRIGLVIQFPISLLIQIIVYGISSLPELIFEYTDMWKPEKL